MQCWHIARQIDHPRRLLDNLPDVARTIYGKMTLDLQRVSLRDVASTVAFTYSRRSPAVAVRAVRSCSSRIRPMRDSLRLLLELDGMEVAAASGREGLARFDAFHPGVEWWSSACRK